MSRRLAGVCLVFLCLLPTLPCAQSSGGNYVLRKQALAGGGARATGGSFELVGTAGQAHAAVASGGSYRLVGGFHQAAGGPPSPSLFANGFE